VAAPAEWSALPESIAAQKAIAQPMGRTAAERIVSTSASARMRQVFRTGEPQRAEQGLSIGKRERNGRSDGPPLAKGESSSPQRGRRKSAARWRRMMTVWVSGGGGGGGGDTKRPKQTVPITTIYHFIPLNFAAHHMIIIFKDVLFRSAKLRSPRHGHQLPIRSSSSRGQYGRMAGFHGEILSRFQRAPARSHVIGAAGFDGPDCRPRADRRGVHGLRPAGTGQGRLRRGAGRARPAKLPECDGLAPPSQGMRLRHEGPPLLAHDTSTQAPPREWFVRRAWEPDQPTPYLLAKARRLSRRNDRIIVTDDGTASRRL